MPIKNDVIKQEDINKAALDACDSLRGVMDVTEYKNYILVIIFIKYISDICEYDAESMNETLENQRFILPENASFYYLYKRRFEDNLGELINNALNSIEIANKSKLKGVFSNIDFNSEINLGKTKDRNRRLKILLEEFHKPSLDMRPNRISEDIIGNTYLYLINNFASEAGKKSGEFYTPKKISELIIKLCKPKAGARICDPSCGSGGLLIEAAKALGNCNYSIYGMEVNKTTWALCRMNMFLHNIDATNIKWCNTLVSPSLVENNKLMKFDNIVANPPFSLDKWGSEEAKTDAYNRFWRGIPPKSKGDYAFISHIVESTVEKKGRATIVVPHGVLFRAGKEKQIRQKLIKENLLDAVIGLPANLFPSASIPVAILIFDRSREKGAVNENLKNIIFIDASQDYQKGKKQNHLTEEELEKIIQTYENKKEIKQYSSLVSYEKIKENNYNLNISRYVDNFQDATLINIEAVEKEINTLENQLKETRSKLKLFLDNLNKKL